MCYKTEFVYIPNIFNIEVVKTLNNKSSIFLQGKQISMVEAPAIIVPKSQINHAQLPSPPQATGRIDKNTFVHFLFCFFL